MKAPEPPRCWACYGAASHSFAEPCPRGHAMPTALSWCWVPVIAYDIWLGRVTRDQGLRDLVGMRVMYNDTTTPGALDRHLGFCMDELDRAYADTVWQIRKVLDRALDAGERPALIRQRIAAVAAEADFDDLNFDWLIRDRVGAWKWRQLHPRGR